MALCGRAQLQAASRVQQSVDVPPPTIPGAVKLESSTGWNGGGEGGEGLCNLKNSVSEEGMQRGEKVEGGKKK